MSGPPEDYTFLMKMEMLRRHQMQQTTSPNREEHVPNAIQDDQPLDFSKKNEVLTKNENEKMQLPLRPHERMSTSPSISANTSTHENSSSLSLYPRHFHETNSSLGVSSRLQMERSDHVRDYPQYFSRLSVEIPRNSNECNGVLSSDSVGELKRTNSPSPVETEVKNNGFPTAKPVSQMNGKEAPYAYLTAVSPVASPPGYLDPRLLYPANMYFPAGNSMYENSILRASLQQPLRTENGIDRKNSKQTRPFKAYNPLPGPYPTNFAFPSDIIEDLAEQERRYQQYVQEYIAQKTPIRKSNSRMETSLSDNQNSSDVEVARDMQSPSTSGQVDSSPPQQAPPLSSDTTEASRSCETNGHPTNFQQAIADTSSQVNRKKRGRSLPEDLKDDAYWERRKKNNEAAKRSRDSRRQREDIIAMRAKFLEDENRELRITINFLRRQLAMQQQSAMVYNRAFHTN